MMKTVFKTNLFAFGINSLMHSNHFISRHFFSIDVFCKCVCPIERVVPHYLFRMRHTQKPNKIVSVFIVTFDLESLFSSHFVMWMCVRACVRLSSKNCISLAPICFLLSLFFRNSRAIDIDTVDQMDDQNSGSPFHPNRDEMKWNWNVSLTLAQFEKKTHGGLWCNKSLQRSPIYRNYP